MNTTRKAFCFRIIVLVTCVIIWLDAVALFGYAMYMRVDYWTNNYLNAHEELRKYFVPVYIFIATGACTIVFSAVGFYGAIRKDRLSLVIYLAALPFIFSALIGGGVYAYIYREEIENTVQNAQILRPVVQQTYGAPNKAEQTVSIDYMQRELQCCGGTSFTDYKGSLWSQEREFVAYRVNKAPLTCCSDYWLYKHDPNEYRFCSMYIEGVIQSGNPLPDINRNIYRVGCGEALVKFFQNHITIVSIIDFILVPLTGLSIIFVAMLIFYLRKVPAPRQDDVVYEMARTQDKSTYPSRGGSSYY